MGAVAPNHVPGNFTPDVALLDLAVTALGLACPPGAERLMYDGLRERYLPEVTARGRAEHRNSQYALYAAASMRGGLEPDLLNDAGSWQPPLWTYVGFAVVIFSRAAADRLGVALREIAERIAQRHGLDSRRASHPQTDDDSAASTRAWAPSLASNVTGTPSAGGDGTRPACRAEFVSRTADRGRCGLSGTAGRS
jgi:hypothetical protein